MIGSHWLSNKHYIPWTRATVVVFGEISEVGSFPGPLDIQIGNPTFITVEGLVSS
jgi:hypothetical protein